MATTDWAAQARREASAVLSEFNVTVPLTNADLLHSLLAAMWLRGILRGSHDTMREVEQALPGLLGR